MQLTRRALMVGLAASAATVPLAACLSGFENHGVYLGWCGEGQRGY